MHGELRSSELARELPGLCGAVGKITVLVCVCRWRYRNVVVILVMLLSLLGVRWLRGMLAHFLAGDAMRQKGQDWWDSLEMKQFAERGSQQGVFAQWSKRE